MTFLTAARGNVDSAVAYYGGGTENHLSESDTVTVPLLMHLGEEDEFISKDAQREIKGGFHGQSARGDAQLSRLQPCFRAAQRNPLRSSCRVDSEQANLDVLCEAFAVIDGIGPGQCRSAGVHQGAFGSGLQAGFL
jgi:dienelactone hydrolase